jgi:hypothetical protein
VDNNQFKFKITIHIYLYLKVYKINTIFINMGKTIKIVLAALLFVCLAEMPYGYFQLVRWVALVGFALLAFDASEKNQQNEFIIYIGLAVLFQPIVKIALGRSIWNIVDVIVGVYLMFSAHGSKRPAR